VAVILNSLATFEHRDARQDGKRVKAHMDSETPKQTSLWLLNGFELRHGDETLRVPLPAQRLLAFLAFQRRALPRRSIARALWMDLGEVQAAARLRSTLWRLPSKADEQLVVSSGGRVHLAASVEVDLRLAEDDLRVGELSVDNLAGEILSDWDDEWVVTERERFRQVRLHRLEQMSERAQQRGRFSLALQAALAAVTIEPLRESAHRRVMLVHLAEDNPSEALRQYDAVRRLLRLHLGLAPSSATRRIVAPYLGRPDDRAEEAS
jgi:DNA-binding SARP family transcriptional activator